MEFCLVQEDPRRVLGASIGQGGGFLLSNRPRRVEEGLHPTRLEGFSWKVTFIQESLGRKVIWPRKSRKVQEEKKDLQDCLNLVPNSCFSWYSIRLYQENSRKRKEKIFSRVLD